MNIQLSKLDAEYVIRVLEAIRTISKSDRTRRDRVVKHLEFAIDNPTMTDRDFNTADDIADRVSEQALAEFCQIEEAGEVTMLDYDAVMKAAHPKKHKHLKALSREVYYDIIAHYQILMCYYNMTLPSYMK